MGVTTIPIKNYVGHLNQIDYITTSNDVLRGKLYQWRLSSCKFLNDLTDMFERPGKATEDQLNFAKYEVLQILKGLDKFNVMCVNLMSIDAIMTYVEGINDCEQAHLVQQIATCNKFELGVVTHDREFNVSVFTMFDDDEDNKYAYGKNNIEDLHYIHHERDNEKHRKMMEEEKEQQMKAQKEDYKNRIVQNPYVTPEKKVTDNVKVISKEDGNV